MKYHNINKGYAPVGFGHRVYTKGNTDYVPMGHRDRGTQPIFPQGINPVSKTDIAVFSFAPAKFDKQWRNYLHFAYLSI